MPGPPYRIVSKVEPVGQGVTGSWYLTLGSIAKNNENEESCPFTIPNEYICGTIGAFIGLNVPPLAIVSDSVANTRKTWIASLNFNFSNILPPPVISSDCVRDFEFDSVGVVMFDLLIANVDRSQSNLAVVQAPDHTSFLSVFDHSHALLGAGHLLGAERLDQLIDSFVISGTSDGDHCLVDELKTHDMFWPWIERIRAIPDFFIDNTVDKVVGLGIDASLADKCKVFLKHRRDKLVDILNAGRDQFSFPQGWLLK